MMEIVGSVYNKNAIIKKKSMKSLYTLLIITLIQYANSQIIIGNTSMVEQGDAILQFEDDLNQGIIVPRIIERDDVNSVEGTVIYDTSDYKIKVKRSSDWQDLSKGALVAYPDSGQNAFDTSENGYDSLIEKQDFQGAIVGNPNATAKGALVLESSNQALVLPRMDNPHLAIKNPEAGTMAYDTISKTLFVFNGLQWTIWGKP